MSKTYEVNEKTFVMPEITLEMDEKLSQIFNDILQGDQLNLSKILNLIGKEKKLRELVTLLLVPEGEKWSEESIENWDSLKYLTNEQLMEVINDFFGSSGPFQTAFQSFSEGVKATEFPTSQESQ